MKVMQHGGVAHAQLPELIRQLRVAASGLESDESQRGSVLEDIEVLADQNQDPQTCLSVGQRIKQAFVEGGTAVGAAGIVTLLENIAGRSEVSFVFRVRASGTVFLVFRSADR
jgi:hypothetical protein